MVKPMSALAFKMMAFGFKVLDRFRPCIDVLREFQRSFVKAGRPQA
jgi:hypothetical protein